MSKKLTIGLLCGGQSLEHEVYLHSAKEIKQSLDPNKYEIVVIGIAKSGDWHLSWDDDYFLPAEHSNEIALNLSKPIVYPATQGKLLDWNTQKCLAKVDVFFLSTMDLLQGFIHTLDVPYVGANLFGTIIGRDKDVMKRLLQEAGFPVAPYTTIRSYQTVAFEELSSQFGVPFFIKPARQGSSLGVSKVSNEQKYYKALQEAYSYDSKILVEQTVTGREIEAAVLGNEHPEVAQALCECEIIDSKDFFTFKVKNNMGIGWKPKILTDLEDTIAQQIRQTAISAFRLLECEGMARVDFFLKSDGSFVINEINTVPGFSKSSTYPLIWEASGVSRRELLDQLIQLALDRQQKEKQLITTIK